jgi:hypothetical protein
MRIVLRYFDGCPNWRIARDRLDRALDRLGARAQVVCEAVETPEDAVRLEFRGYPTLLVDGRDPLADSAGSIGLSCRISQTDQGPQGAPSIEQLVEVLRRQEM